MIKSLGNPEKGHVLIYVIAAVVLGMILSAALYQSVFLSNRLFIQHQNNKLAYYAAVSGVEYASHIIKSTHYTITTPVTWPYTNFDPTGGTVLGVNVTVAITSTGEPPTYTITSTAQYAGTTKTLIVTCASTGSVISWGSS